MTELLPSIEAIASQTLESARSGRRVYVEGPVGSGRNSLMSALAQLEPSSVVLELLQLAESDAPAVALLDVASQLGTADAWPTWKTGAEDELHALARRVGQQLADANRLLLIRMPDSWLAVENARATADALPTRARSMLGGLFQSAAATVLVADAALTPGRLGFHPNTRVQLRPHTTSLSALEHVQWGEYQSAFDGLRRAIPKTINASPLAWRLAVGASALGAPHDELQGHLASSVPLPRLTQALVGQLRVFDAVRRAVQRFLAIRRSVPSRDACTISQVPTEHAPLVLQCIGYGTTEIRVSTVLRNMLANRLGDAADPVHAELATHYANVDGAASPIGLPTGELRSWCEKVHHLAHAGDVGEQWDKLDLVSPNLYWDRARHLSVIRRDYRGAAQIYRRCVERFPQDDYAWHYLGFNLERAGTSVDQVRSAYAKAVELNPEHPWWNGRLVTLLISKGRPREAQDEWRATIGRVDPEGTQVSASPWLAMNLHLWVCRAWLRTGRLQRARAVLDLIPRRLTSRGPLRTLKQRTESKPPQWTKFLSHLETSSELSTSHATAVRRCWSILERKQPDLPLPFAGRTTEDAFQFTWSYDSVLLEVDVTEDGACYWFAKDRETGDAADGTLNCKDQIPSAFAHWLETVASA